LFFATYSIFILSTVASLIVAPTPDGQKRSSMFIAFWIVNIVVFGLGNLFMLALDLPELGLILCILSLIGGWILGLNALFREQKNTAGMATALWINAICLTGGPGGVIAIWLIFTDS
jgi:uncharacterized membrane protein